MHTSRILTTVLLAVTLIACAAVQPAATQPSASSSTQPGDDAAANPAHQWLERIEQRADEIDTLRATLRYERVAGLLEDRQIRAGNLHYDAGPPPRFAVHFNRAVINDRLREQDRRYIFDGRWLAELQEERKVFIRRELVPENQADQEGEQMLELTGGPFLLPLDLDKDQVLERFEVSLIPADDDAQNSSTPDSAANGPGDDADEPLANTVHLRLTPRPHVNAQQERIDVWYDRDTALPVRVRSEERGADHWIVDLTQIETGVEIDESRFDTRPPQEPGWQVEYAEGDGSGE